MRILIAGTSSGCGKTTMSILLMAALRLRGLDVMPYKVGPDYVDPGFHRVVTGNLSYNLDSWIMKREHIPSLLKNNSDISVIEGVMGYYDGLNAESFDCSTYEIARLTDTPVLLTVDASGGAASVAATVKGFKMLAHDSLIKGVLVNRVSSEGHFGLIQRAVERHTGLKCFGYLKKQTNLELPSRQLGLVPAMETPNLMKRISEAAAKAIETLNTDAILGLAATAPEIKAVPSQELPDRRGYRLGVAMDDGFNFYYRANLETLKNCGMELVYFSPMRDSALPEGLSGLYIGGGYPEVFKERLSANASMRNSIKRALEGGLSCYAECGGLMYLGSEIDGAPMVGFLPLKSRMTDRLQRFGYVTVTDKSGLSFPAHEFHHALSEPLAGASFAYEVTKASRPQNKWACGYEKGAALAAFAHVYFADKPWLIQRFFK